MKVRYSYLKQQFSNSGDLWAKLKKFVSTGDFTLGKELEKFEKNFARLIGSKYAVGVNSGTDAIKLSLRVLNVEPGDEVITAANTFVATANVGVMCGATIDFVDIDSETLNMCPDHLEHKLEIASLAGSLPKIISIVHFAGEPANMERFYDLSNRYGFKIIEDAKK